MRILLTNDDGYRAESINMLFDLLSKAGHEVNMVAPERNSSGAGQSIAVYLPITITQIEPKKYFVSSTPADSVRLGLQVIYKDPKHYPDLVISGVNLGENVGEDVYYSGTIGAAREATLHRIPSLAFSTSGTVFNHLDSAAQIVLDLVNKIEKNQEILQSPFLWNINIPNKPFHLINGYETTKLALRSKHENLEEQLSPRGQKIFWQAPSAELSDAPIGTDLHVILKQEKVSVTPLALLPTEYNQMHIISALTS